MNFENLTDALKVVAQIKARARDACQAIFCLKQDETIAPGDYAVQRMRLYGNVQAAEDELAAVEQWIKEERARQDAALVIKKETRAAKARADGLANEEAKAKLDLDRRATKEEGWRRDDGNQRRANVRLREALRLAVAALDGQCHLLRARALILEAFPEILEQIDRMGIPVVLEPSWLGKQRALGAFAEPVTECPVPVTVAENMCREQAAIGGAWGPGDKFPSAVTIPLSAEKREKLDDLMRQLEEARRGVTVPPFGDITRAC